MCLAGVLVPAMGFAQTTVREDRTVPVTSDVRVVDPAHPMKHADREFVERAAKSSMSEVLISRVAVERTTNPEVKHFAQMIIDDHTSASEQLATLASTRGLALPAKDPNPDRWEKRDAKDFDKDYVDKMVSDHKDVVKLFENQANKGEDADTVAFARKQLPKLQKHLEQALDLKRMLHETR